VIGAILHGVSQTNLQAAGASSRSASDLAVVAALVSPGARCGAAERFDVTAPIVFAAVGWC
jgi:hypothetical protein